jgi:hypothetical protein
MTDNVGIWIDHAHAVIVHASTSGVRAETLESHLGSHHRYSARAGAPSHDSDRAEGGEKKYEEQYGQLLNEYYDTVIDHLGDAGAVLILGPGEAKLQLKERMGRSKSLSHTTVGLETADKLTEPQIVAKVMEHYGIDA